MLSTAVAGSIFVARLAATALAEEERGTVAMVVGCSSLLHKEGLTPPQWSQAASTPKPRMVKDG